MSKVLVDDALQLRMGTISIEWAYVDTACGEWLSHMLSADPGSMYVITQSVAASSVSGWIRTLVPVKFADEEKQPYLLDLLNRIDEARADRNALVHGLWVGNGPDSAIIQTVGWHRSVVLKYELVTLHDLEELIERIRGIGDELGEMGNALGFQGMAPLT